MLPAMDSFVWNLYERTGDVRFVQGMYLQNASKTEGLPRDLFAADPETFQQLVQQIIDRVGTRIDLPSVNKQQWRLGLLRSGIGENQRVMWLDYDTGGAHAHADGMNLGLFAKGLDLMPDFGYPPVQYGGWGAPRAQWYVSSMAHNTVVVDGQNSRAAGGKTTLWADGRQVHGMAASCSQMIGGTQYERTAAMIDVSDNDAYIVDVFRVVGGKDHARFVRSHFGSITTQGVPAQAASIYAGIPHMRNWRGGPAQPGWSVDWKIEDHYKLLDKPADLHVGHTDLTAGAESYTGESWVSTVQNGFTGTAEAWVPHVVVRRTGEAPLSSTFVSVVEPYEANRHIAGIRRIAAHGDAEVALDVALTDGRRDLIISHNVENPVAASQPASFTFDERAAGATLDGQLCIYRRDAKGEPLFLALGHTRRVTLGDLAVQLANQPEYVEIAFASGAARVTVGKPADVKEISVAGKRWSVEAAQ